MSDRPPRIPSCYLLVPGPWDHASEVVTALGRAGIDAQVRPDTPIQATQTFVQIIEDSELEQAFTWGRYGPLPPDLVDRISVCQRAALLEVGVRIDQAPATVAALGRALRDAGGVAVRMEASGSAWAWQPWLERLDAADAADVYGAVVLSVQWDDGVLFTCGMHHFDLPDAEIVMEDPADALSWLDIFNIWQLAESPDLASGHTFQPDADADRRVFERWPDHRHDSNDGRHNPFGLWRFLAPGQAGIQASALSPVIMPPLRVLLQATEEQQGRPLTREEVQELVDKAPAIAMERSDARAMEQARGYADIEPARAWEQWQLVRPPR